MGDAKKTEIVRIRVTKAELSDLAKVAQHEGLTVPELLMKPWREDK